jgi:hypothetical protein
LPSDHPERQATPGSGLCHENPSSEG